MIYPKKNAFSAKTTLIYNVRVGTSSHHASLEVYSLEILGSAVEEGCSIMESSLLVVPQKALPPNAPRSCISQLWNGSIEEGDGGAAVVVVRDPLHGLVDAIVAGIHEALADFLGGRLMDDYSLENLVNTIPNVPHMEFVYDALQRRPVRPQSVAILADSEENLIDRVHGGRGESRANRVFRRVGDYFLWRVSVHVYRRYSIVHGGLGVETLQALHSHGVDGVRDRFVKVLREP